MFEFHKIVAFTKSRWKASAEIPAIEKVFGMMLLLSSTNGFILVENFLLLKLERAAGFCWEKPWIEINKNRIKDRIFPGFKQHYFKKLKLTFFGWMKAQSAMNLRFCFSFKWKWPGSWLCETKTIYFIFAKPCSNLRKSIL